MRNQVYSRYIYQMLMEFDRVCIPTLGTFTLEFANATFKEQKTLLSPPATKVHFVKEEDHAFALSKLLIESGMNNIDAQSIENLAIEDIASSGKVNYPFELDGLGTIINQVFLEKDVRIFNKFDGLVDIAVNPIPITKKQVQHQDEYLFKLKNPYKQKEGTDWAQFLWPILAGLLTMMCIIFWFFSDKKPTQPIPASASVVLSDSISSVDTMMLLDNTLIDDTNFVNESSTSDSENVSLSKPNQPINDLVPTQKNVIKNETYFKSCVVIVGAFKNSRNATKLIKRIKSKGYETYSSDHNGLKRVGVSYDCSVEDPELFKSKIKGIFNKDAWHLHDTI